MMPHVTISIDADDPQVIKYTDNIINVEFPFLQTKIKYSVSRGNTVVLKKKSYKITMFTTPKVEPTLDIPKYYPAAEAWGSSEAAFADPLQRNPKAASKKPGGSAKASSPTAFQVPPSLEEPGGLVSCSTLQWPDTLVEEPNSSTKVLSKGTLVAGESEVSGYMFITLFVRHVQ